MKRPANALALAVLTLLYEKPMHPYEMSATLRHRSKEESIKLNYGSLYAVVESLRRRVWSRLAGPGARATDRSAPSTR